MSLARALFQLVDSRLLTLSLHRGLSSVRVSENRSGVSSSSYEDANPIHEPPSPDFI